jgi:hypothetical protein
MNFPPGIQTDLLLKKYNFHGHKIEDNCFIPLSDAKILLRRILESSDLTSFNYVFSIMHRYKSTIKWIIENVITNGSKEMIVIILNEIKCDVVNVLYDVACRKDDNVEIFSIVLDFYKGCPIEISVWDDVIDILIIHHNNAMILYLAKNKNTLSYSIFYRIINLPDTDSIIFDYLVTQKNVSIHKNHAITIIGNKNFGILQSLIKFVDKRIILFSDNDMRELFNYCCIKGEKDLIAVFEENYDISNFLSGAIKSVKDDSIKNYLISLTKN